MRNKINCKYCYNKVIRLYGQPICPAQLLAGFQALGKRFAEYWSTSKSDISYDACVSNGGPGNLGSIGLYSTGKKNRSNDTVQASNGMVGKKMTGHCILICLWRAFSLPFALVFFDEMV